MGKKSSRAKTATVDESENKELQSERCPHGLGADCPHCVDTPVEDNIPVGDASDAPTTEIPVVGMTIETFEERIGAAVEVMNQRIDVRVDERLAAFEKKMGLAVDELTEQVLAHVRDVGESSESPKPPAKPKAARTTCDSKDGLHDWQVWTTGPHGWSKCVTCGDMSLTKYKS